MKEASKKLGVGGTQLNTMDLQSNGWNQIKNIKHQRTNGEDKNSKLQQIYGTKFRYFIVKGPK